MLLWPTRGFALSPVGGDLCQGSDWRAQVRVGPGWQAVFSTSTTLGFAFDSSGSISMTLSQGVVVHAMSGYGMSFSPCVRPNGVKIRINILTQQNEQTAQQHDMINQKLTARWKMRSNRNSVSLPRLPSTPCSASHVRHKKVQQL